MASLWNIDKKKQNRPFSTVAKVGLISGLVSIAFGGAQSYWSPNVWNLAVCSFGVLLLGITLYWQERDTENERLRKQQREIRQKKLESITKEAEGNIEFKEEEILKKIKNTRSYYCKELMKIEKSKVTGSGAEEIYTPTWEYFDLLAFLRSVVTPKSSSYTEIDITAEDVNEVEPETQSSTSSVVIPKKKKKKATEEDLMEAVIQSFATPPPPPATHAPKDQWSYFCEYVAEALRSMPLESALRLKRIVSTAIYDEQDRLMLMQNLTTIPPAGIQSPSESSCQQRTLPSPAIDLGARHPLLVNTAANWMNSAIAPPYASHIQEQYYNSTLSTLGNFNPNYLNLGTPNPSGNLNVPTSSPQNAQNMNN